ncbi:MAG TPA: cytochrome c [Planctomycetota bacterium]|nr:cytochrome c [Planctomycetota bacterium]
MGLALAGLLASCDHAPGHAPMHYTLSTATKTSLASAPEVQDQILGSLEMLFGTPQNPSYLRTKDWADAEFDPNHAELAADAGGTGELAESEMNGVKADNLVRFRSQLEQVARRDYAGLAEFKSAPHLSDRVAAIVADKELAEDKRQADLKALFENYYPSLRDSTELYRQQCLHCHGVEGGGDGPTAGSVEHPFLDPRPRDYRLGKFKFTAVKDKARPRRQDLYRVLDQGVYGTAMPSFRRFSAAERWGLVDYVRMLAIRGEVEHDLVITFQDDEHLTAEAPLAAFQDVWTKWQAAKEKVVVFEGDVPAPTPAMLKRGDELFHDAKKGNCASCHGDMGLGDGPAAYKLDDQGHRVPAYTDDWGNPILPRNLVQGLYRGGRRPIDVYRRIYAGINGGPMPGIGESKDADGKLVLPPEDMWALVHYVRSLSERDEAVAGGPIHGMTPPGEGGGGGN